MLTAIDAAGEFRDRIDDRVEFEELGIRRTRYAALALLRLIRRARPRVLFSTLTRVNMLLLGLRCVLPERPRIVIRQPTMPARDLTNLRPRWIYRLLYPRLLGAADVIVSQSAVMTTSLRRHVRPGLARVVTIGNPAPDADWAALRSLPSPFEAGTNFLCVGRLSAEKGQDVLLDAFALALQRLSAIRLTFVGQGPLADPLKAQAERLGIADRVSFAGFCPDPGVYLAHADALVLPSRWEGFPNALLEAISAGIPVVATECDGVSAEIVQPGINGYLVPTEDPAAMAEAMLRVLGLRSQGAEPIRQTIDRFRSERIMAAYREVLLGLAAP
ncbi:N-acetylgalactosamine-N, N'-diacetylbacillosaminyl-diphospho-undecaprenol 4-alpha-N-acetylgalactosaminyltransferase [Gammaproteobacteria bacterium]|nr:N-acetylgalactosamine-N, N'-diacetylbacillosaminyl-diphospho-undecaprenol 4-alpha-N-acetylgalactosaminyltransferase [Gammaproteobacteria bacterium]